MTNVYEKARELISLLEEYGFEYDYNMSLGLIRISGNVKYIYDYDNAQYDFCQGKNCITVVHSWRKRILKINDKKIELPEDSRVYFSEGYLLIYLF